MPPGAGDRVLFGGPPDAGDFVPGGTWLWGWTNAATPNQIELNVYAYAPPNAVDWGNAWEDATAFTLDYAPSGQAPGLWTASHDYGRAGVYRGYVESPARNTFNADIGSVPVWDPEKREFMWPPAKRYAKAREEAVDMRRQMKVPAGNRRR